MENPNDAQTYEAPNQFVPEIEIKLESSDEEETITLGKGFLVESTQMREANDVQGQRPPRKRKSTSEVWQFFYRDATNICRAICGLCRISVSRGKLGGSFGTTALKRHLESKHPIAWAQRESMRAQRTCGGEEEEYEAIEEEKEEPCENASNAQSALYSSPPTSETQDVMPTSSSQLLDSLKTYEIIDSSEDEGEEYKERAEQVPVELEEDMDRKRMKMLAQDEREAVNSCPHFTRDSNPNLPMLSVGQSSSHALIISNNPQAPLGALRRKSPSAVWRFFCIDRTNICRAVCTLCHLSVSRGKREGHFGTTALMRHLEGKHPLEWGRDKINKPKNIIEVDEDEDEETDEPLEQIYHRPQVILGLYGSPTHHETYSTEISGVMTPPVMAIQVDYNIEDKELTNEKIRNDLSVTTKDKLALPPSDDLHIKGKYAPNHPKAQSWNRNIAELMCGAALPYSFITSKAFKKFMTRTDPKYCVPSKSFFSGKAVPQLYEAVCEKVMHELKRSESYHIHLTTHLWSSGPSMNYLALTAHWAVLNTDNLHSVQRKYAVLCTKGFPKDCIDGSIQQELTQQINRWLVPNVLSPGFFISSGNFNLIHAIKSANFHFIPCFTHTLNVLVMDFLQNNRCIASTIEAARKVCSHFIHSASARKTLSELQFQNNLPNRHLKAETLPHWTSTFYMLQRLLEQQRAIEVYLGSLQLETADLHLTSSNWSLIACLVDLLQPFEMVTREVSAGGSCLSQVLPEVRYLHIFLKQIRGHFESKGDVKGVILIDNFTLKISSDFGINEMFQREEYVLSTLLDPRFKGRIEAILPPGSDIDLWKQILVKKVKEIMSSSLWPASHFKDSSLESDLLASKNYHVAEGGMNFNRRTMVAPPLIQKEKSLIEHLESVGLLASKSTGASLSTESHSACVMVEKYLQDNQTIGAREDPLVYWKTRKCLWPALAKLAFMYLTCPPSSVFAERVFTVPCTFGGMKKPPDVEHFGFLMVNLEHFPDYVTPPLIFSSDNEAESDSEEA